MDGVLSRMRWRKRTEVNEMGQKQGKGKIGYLHYTWSPVKGRCGFAQEGKPCPYCWMEDFWKRFEKRKDGTVLMDQEIRLDKKELNWTPRGNQRIGVCFSTDLFHPLVLDDYVEEVLKHIRKNQQHDYVLLTKASEHLGKFDLPSNAWVGVSVDGSIETQASAIILAALDTNAKYKWISFEPLIYEPTVLLNPPHDVIWNHIHWIVIGPDSRRGARPPRQEWVEQLIEKSREHDVAVWMKDKLIYDGPRLQELPDGKSPAVEA